MIDKIRIRLDNPRFQPTKDKEFSYWKKQVNNKGIEYRKYYKKIFMDKESKVELRVVLYKFIKTGNTRIIFERSIRKWYKKGNTHTNLSYKQYIDCINRIEEKIGLEKGNLWEATVTRIEIGVTTGLSQFRRLSAIDRNFLLCISNHKDLGEGAVYPNETVKFKGGKYSVIFYDKNTEIFRERGRKIKIGNKINRYFFSLRYEIQINKVSNVKLFGGKINTLTKVKEHWAEIGEELTESLNKTRYVNVISEEQVKTLDNCNKKEMEEYLIYKGMEAVGYKKCLQLFMKMTAGNRSKSRDAFNKIYEEHSEKDGTALIERVLKKLKSDIARLISTAPGGV